MLGFWYPPILMLLRVLNWLYRKFKGHSPNSKILVSQARHCRDHVRELAALVANLAVVPAHKQCHRYKLVSAYHILYHSLYSPRPTAARISELQVDFDSYRFLGLSARKIHNNSYLIELYSLKFFYEDLVFGIH